MSYSSESVPLNSIVRIGDAVHVTAVSVEQDKVKQVVFASQVADTDDRFVWIEIPEEHYKHLHVGSAVTISWIDEEANLHSRIEDVLPHRLLKVEGNEAFRSQFLKRRQHVRVSIRFPVEILSASGSKLVGQSVNLSGGGMRFTSSGTFEKGTPLALMFKIEQSAQPLKVKAVVLGDAPATGYTTSGNTMRATFVQFVDLSPRDEQLIVSHCFRHEVMQRKHLQ